MAAADVPNCDEECRPEKAVRKRRSSIFQTKIVTCDQDDAEIINKKKTCTSEKNENECNVQERDVENFNLKEYIDRLRQERKDWQEEYRKRRIERKMLTKEKASIEVQGQVLDINVLSESERTFLLKRPNYEHICKQCQKLSNLALKISTLNQLIHKLNERFMEKMESNILKGSKTIIKMSER